MSRHRSADFATLAAIIVLSSAVHGDNNDVSMEENTFEDGDDGWKVENGSWVRADLQSLPEDFPHPPDPASQKVMVPSQSSNFHHLAMMTKNLTVPANTSLEVFFTCIAIGWKDDVIARMNNPILQLFYDDTLVFRLETAITEDFTHYAKGKWNHFRLRSSYISDTVIKLAILGVLGNREGNLVAIDDVVIKMTTSHHAEDTEPEADVQEEKGGEWETLKTDSEEDEDAVISNNGSAILDLSVAPEFCNLLSETGPCSVSLSRYFYNFATGECEKFVYGGCGGNENNFREKLACETVCKKPNASEQENMLRSSPSAVIANLSLDFEDDFGDWDQSSWRLLSYDSILAHMLKIEAFNKSSKAGGRLTHRRYTIFRRPSLTHPLDLVPSSNLTMTFSLKLLGRFNPSLQPFFENMNPGFKIYIGDDLIFDYATAGSADDNWHNYSVSRNTDDILSFPRLNDNGSHRQILRIEAWEGSGGYVVLDDFGLTQFPLASTTTPSSTTTSASPTSSISPPSFPCLLKKSAGPCKANMSRFYYAPDSGKCLPFTYSGCRGNANNFKTADECQKKCMSSPDSFDDEDMCKLKESTGECHAYMERFYFDFNGTNSCQMFIYGGCGGNGNNFVSKSDCERMCSHHMDKSEMSAHEFMPSSPRKLSDCRQPYNVGHCDALINMFAYNSSMKQCVSFTYSGCGGGNNLFFTKKECVGTCGSLIDQVDHAPGNRPKSTNFPRPLRCHLPRVPGSGCASNESMSSYWFFSVEAAKCLEEQKCLSLIAVEEANHFESLAKCHNVCEISSVQKRPKSMDFQLKDCLLEPKAGGCDRNLKRYFYNVNENDCMEFTYGGCSGNENNFLTHRKCLDACADAEMKIASAKVSLCEEPKRVGSCHERQRMFFFDPASNKCTQFVYSGCGGNRNRFSDISLCQLTCEIPLVEKEIADQKEKKSLGANIAEAVLGVVLIILALVAVALGVKYYRVHQAKESYRQFNNQQLESSRSGSVSSLASYDNPVYSETNGDSNAIQLSGTSNSNNNHTFMTQ